MTLLLLGLSISSAAGQPAERETRRRISRGGRVFEIESSTILPQRLRRRPRRPVGLKPQRERRSRLPDALQLPLIFEENRGQAKAGVRYITRGPSYAAAFSDSSFATMVARYRASNDLEDSIGQANNANIVQFSLQGAAMVQPKGAKQIKGKVNQFIGSQSRWIQDIPAYEYLRYSNIYPGIEMYIHGTSSRLQYGFVVESDGDPRSIRIRLTGLKDLRLDSDGNLIMETSGGSIVQSKPTIVEEVGEEKRLLKGSFVVRGNEVRFQVSGRSAGSRLIIDPQIVFASYFGGTGNEGMLGNDTGARDFINRGFDIAYGPQGHVFVVGMTASPDFPVTGTTEMNGTSDVFAMRIDPTSGTPQLVYASFIGGSRTERGRGIAPADGGYAYITGHTSSNDFPTSPGTVHPGTTTGGYLVRLTPDGLFDIGTRIGTTDGHHPNAVVFDSNTQGDAVYVAGAARPAASAEATPEAAQTTHGGDSFDGFVAKLDPDLVGYAYFSLLGGSRRDVIMDLEVHDGWAYVTGTTTSLDFPTTELAAQPDHSQAQSSAVDCTASDAPVGECADVFVARFNHDGTALLFSTFFGDTDEDFARGIAVAQNGQPVVTGGSRPSTGDGSIFVVRLESGGGAVLYDTRLASDRGDHGEEIVVDSFGRAHIVGSIRRDGFMNGFAAEPFHGGNSDIFYARLLDSGSVDFFTYLGGSGTDRGFAIAAEGTSVEEFCVGIAGSTTSVDINVVNELQSESGGGADLLLYGLCDVDITLPPPAGSIDFDKFTSTPSIQQDETARFVVNLTNNTDSAFTVTLTDELPAQLQLTGAAGPGCGANPSTNTVTCPNFVANPGSNSLEIYATGATCNRTATNRARITAGGFSLQSSSASVFISCIPPPCGNGALDAGEQCDDGNNTNGDGCRSNCTEERCLDGIQDPGESCDDGGYSGPNDTCDTGCNPIIPIDEDCGDRPELCADGLVCGKGCAYVDDTSCIGIPLPNACIGIVVGDEYWLYDLDWTCMSADNACSTHP